MGNILTPAEYKRFYALYSKFIGNIVLTIPEVNELNGYFSRLKLYKQQLPKPKPGIPPSTVPIAQPPLTDSSVLV